ncbi:aldehyde dehydrogenase family protein [Krasilnikovia sp. M28-CT-15]|uniref:aldehyde dehydrogenase family protein n=1 Tax=Krasilnikovia sp. M28-CT-15 TaxID=3373540 RepID=UPI0038764EB3
MTATTTLAGAPLGDHDGDVFADRLHGLRAVHDYLARRPAEVLSLLCRFSLRRAAEYELDAAVRTLAGALDEVRRHRPVTVRRLAAFMPSNVVLYSYVLYLLVPSLFAEELHFRPASDVREETLALHRLLAPLHRAPIEARPVSQRVYLHDSVAAADVVVFTGAYQNAERIRPQLAAEQLFLFLGAGVNPFIVAPGADLAQAARDAVAIRTLNSGQDCLAPDLFLVHRSVAERFLDLLVNEVSKLRFGANDDPGADYGTIHYADALEASAVYLSRNRERIVHGGNVDFRSRRLDPAVLVGDLTGRTGAEEFFTPVFEVLRYSDPDALARTLSTGIFAERALGASVYGDAPELAQSLRRRHTVTVNAPLTSIDDGNAPFGGFGPMANYAAHQGRLRIAPILISAAVAEHLGTRHE